MNGTLTLTVIESGLGGHAHCFCLSLLVMVEPGRALGGPFGVAAAAVVAI